MSTASSNWIFGFEILFVQFCLWNPESWVLESRIQLYESGIPLTTEIQNPSSTDKYWNPESKTVLITLHGAKSSINQSMHKLYFHLVFMLTWAYGNQNVTFPLSLSTFSSSPLWILYSYSDHVADGGILLTDNILLQVKRDAFGKYHILTLLVKQTNTSKCQLSLRGYTWLFCL